MKYFFLISLVFIVLTSCERNEIPLEYNPTEHGEGTMINQLDMSADYRYRIYYDLESNSEVSRHLKTDFDLSFSCQANDFTIRLNDSKLMSAWKVVGESMEEVMALAGEGPLYDTSDGVETALSNWLSEPGVYIIDRGYDPEGTPLGKYKIELLSADENAYQLRYAPLTANEYETIEVPKDPSRNEIQLSFDSGIQTLEPEKGAWDLLFTHYTFYFEVEDLPYLVAGVLLNPYEVEAQQLELTNFESIDAEYVDSVSLVSTRDVIGYDWKYFDLESQVYEVVDNAYVVKTTEANHFKLQFTGFLNAIGERGAPEFQLANVE